MDKWSSLTTEINLIVNPLIRKFVQVTLDNVPENFYHVPASRTGKYHPKATLGDGGLLVHVKRVVYICYRLSGGWNIVGEDRDIAIAGCILHDIAKAGYNSCYKDYENHPINAEKYFAKDLWPEKDNKIYEKIANCVKYHMGPWSPAIIKKPLGKYTPLELLVYTSDYIAATRLLDTPVDGNNYNEELYKQCL